MQSLKILPMDSCHINDLINIEKLCFNTGWSANTLASVLCDKNSYFYVVYVDDTLAAYGGVRIILDEANLDNIAVHPDFQRKGIAAALLKHLISICAQKNVQTLMLEVRISNTNAISLYEKFGFYTVGYRNGYYTNPTETAVLMNMEINNENK